jgi:hypothetical protein
MTSLIVAFHNFSKAAKNSCRVTLVARNYQPTFHEERVMSQAA